MIDEKKVSIGEKKAMDIETQAGVMNDPPKRNPGVMLSVDPGVATPIANVSPIKSSEQSAVVPNRNPGITLSVDPLATSDPGQEGQLDPFKAKQLQEEQGGYTSPNMTTGADLGDKGLNVLAITAKSGVNSLLDGMGSILEYNSKLGKTVAKATEGISSKTREVANDVFGEDVAKYLSFAVKSRILATPVIGTVAMLSESPVNEPLDAAGKALKDFDFGGATKVSDADAKEYWIASGLGSGLGQVIPMLLTGWAGAAMKAPRIASLLNSSSVFAAEATGYIDGFEKETGKKIEDNPGQFIAATAYGAIAAKLEQLGLDPSKFGSRALGAGSRAGLISHIDDFIATPEMRRELFEASGKGAKAIFTEIAKTAGLEGLQEGLQTLAEKGVSYVSGLVTENKREIGTGAEIWDETWKSAAIGALVGGIVSGPSYLSKSNRTQHENLLFDFIHNGVDVGAETTRNPSLAAKANAFLFESNIEDKKDRVDIVNKVIDSSSATEQDKIEAKNAIQQIVRISNNIGGGISGDNAMTVFDYLKKADAIDAEIKAIASGRDGSPSDVMNETRIIALKNARSEFAKAVQAIGSGKVVPPTATAPKMLGNNDYNSIKDFLSKDIFETAIASTTQDSQADQAQSAPAARGPQPVNIRPAAELFLDKDGNAVDSTVTEDEMLRGSKEAKAGGNVAVKKDNGDYVIMRQEQIPAQMGSRDVTIGGETYKDEFEIAPARIEYTPVEFIPKGSEKAADVEKFFTNPHAYNVVESKGSKSNASKTADKSAGTNSSASGESLANPLSDLISSNSSSASPKSIENLVPVGTELYITRGKGKNTKIVPLTVVGHNKAGQVIVKDEKGSENAINPRSASSYYLSKRATSISSNSAVQEPSTQGAPSPTSSEEAAKPEKSEKSEKAKTADNPAGRSTRAELVSMNSIIGSSQKAKDFVEFLNSTLMPFIKFAYNANDGSSRSYPTGLRLMLGVNSKAFYKKHRAELAKYLEALASGEGGLNMDSKMFTRKKEKDGVDIDSEYMAIKFLYEAYKSKGFRFRFGNKGNFNAVQEEETLQGTLTPYRGSVLMPISAIEQAVKEIPGIIDSQYGEFMSEETRDGIAQIALAYAFMEVERPVIDSVYASEEAIQKGIESTERLTTYQQDAEDAASAADEAEAAKILDRRAKGKRAAATEVAKSLPSDELVEDSDPAILELKKKYSDVLSSFGAKGKSMVARLMTRAMELSAMTNAEFDAMIPSERAKAKRILEFVHEVDKYLITYNYEKARSDSRANEGSGKSAKNNKRGGEQVEAPATTENPRQDIRFASTPAGVKLKELATGIEARKDVENPQESSRPTEQQQKTGRNEDVVANLVDRRVEYNGERGVIRQDEGGKITFESEDQVIELEGTEMAVDYIPDSVKYGNGIVSINDSTYTYISTNENEDGDVVSVTLQKKNGKKVTIRDKELALAIDFAKNTSELESNKVELSPEEEVAIVSEQVQLELGGAAMGVIESMPDEVLETFLIMEQGIVALAPDELQLMATSASEWADSAMKEIEDGRAPKKEKEDAIRMLKKFNKQLNQYYNAIERQKSKSSNAATEQAGTKQGSEKPTESKTGKSKKQQESVVVPEPKIEVLEAKAEPARQEAQKAEVAKKKKAKPEVKKEEAKKEEVVKAPKGVPGKELTRKEFNSLEDGDVIVYGGKDASEGQSYVVVDKTDRSGKIIKRTYKEVGVVNGTANLEESDLMFWPNQEATQEAAPTQEATIEPSQVEPTAVEEAAPAEEVRQVEETPKPARPVVELTMEQAVTKKINEMVRDDDGVVDIKQAAIERRSAADSAIRIRLEIEKSKAAIKDTRDALKAAEDSNLSEEVVAQANEAIAKREEVLANQERILAIENETIRQYDALLGRKSSGSITTKISSSLADAKETFASNDRFLAILNAAEKAYNALRGMYPNLNIIVHTSTADYLAAEDLKYGSSARPFDTSKYQSRAFIQQQDGRTEIHINGVTSEAKEVVHEAVHSALSHYFGTNTKEFESFKKSLSSILRFSRVSVRTGRGRSMKIGKYLESFASQYEGVLDENGNPLSKADIAEEYLVELSAVMADQGNQLGDSIVVKVIKLINSVLQKIGLGSNVLKDTVDAIEFFDKISKSFALGSDLSKTKLTIAKIDVHSEIDNILAQVSKAFPEVGIIKSSLAPIRPSVAELSNSEKFTLLKKAFGETTAKLIRGNMPLAFENTESLIPFLKEKIPVKEHMGYILKEMGIEVEKDFFAKPENQAKQKSSDPGDLLKEVGYTFYKPLKNLDEAEPFRTYYEGEGSDGRIGGSIICTYRDPNRPKANFVMFIVKNDATETMRATQLTQDNLSNSWKKYLEAKGKKNEDGTFNLSGLRAEREDPFSTSVLAIQVNKSNGSLKMISRYNHDLEYGNPDITFGGDLNKITDGLEDSIYNYVGVSKSKQKTNSLPENVISDSEGKLFRYGMETGGVYYGDGFYMKNGKSTILDPATEKLINGVIFKNGRMDTVLHAFYASEAGSIFLQQNPTITTLPGGVVRITFHKEARGDNRTVIGSTEVPVKNGRSMQSRKVDEDLSAWFIKNNTLAESEEGVPMIYADGNLHMFLGDSPIIIKDSIRELHRISDYKGIIEVQEDLAMSSDARSLGNIKSIGGTFYSGSGLEDLGELTTVGGAVYLNRVKIKSLGKIRKIGKDLAMHDSEIETTGELESVRSILAKNSALRSIPNIIQLEGDLEVGGSKLEDIGILKYIGGRMAIASTPLESLEDIEYIEDELIATDGLKSLGKLRAVGGGINFMNNLMPADNLEVAEGGITLREGYSAKLPKLRSVQGSLFLNDAISIDAPSLEVISNNLIIGDAVNYLNLPSLKFAKAVFFDERNDSAQVLSLLDDIRSNGKTTAISEQGSTFSEQIKTKTFEYPNGSEVREYSSKIKKRIESEVWKKVINASAARVKSTATEALAKVKSSLAPVISAENSSNYANMTEDGQGNFVFYHYGPRGIDSIDPTRYGSNKNRATSPAEIAAMGRVGGMAQYYVNNKTAEPGVSGDKYMVKVPKEKVYDFNTDPLNLIDRAKEAFKSENPDAAFSPNDQLAYVAKESERLGYDMVVSEWKNTTRAQSTKSLTPSDVQIIDGNRIVSNFKEDYESNSTKGFVSNIPVSKRDVLQKVYDDIYKERNAASKYDSLYRLASNPGEYTQDQITEMINNSDLSDEIKSRYAEAEQYVPAPRSSERKTNGGTPESGIDPRQIAASNLKSVASNLVSEETGEVIKDRQRIKSSLNPIFRTDFVPASTTSIIQSPSEFMKNFANVKHRFSRYEIEELARVYAPADDRFENPRLVAAMIENLSYGKAIGSFTPLADVQRLVPGITADEVAEIDDMLFELSDPKVYLRNVLRDHIILPDGRVIEESSWLPKMAEESIKYNIPFMRKDLMSLATAVDWVGVPGSGFYEFFTGGYTNLRETASTHTNRLTEKNEAIIAESERIAKENGKGVIMTGRTSDRRNEYDNLEKVKVNANTKDGVREVELSIGEAISMILTHNYLADQGRPTFLDAGPIRPGSDETDQRGVHVTNKNFEGVLTLEPSEIAKLESAIGKYSGLVDMIKDYYHGPESMEMYRDITRLGLNHDGNVAQVEDGYIPIDVRVGGVEADESVQASEVAKFEATGFQLTPRSAKQIDILDIGMTMHKLVAQAKIGLLNVPVQNTIRWYFKKFYKASTPGARVDAHTLRPEYKDAENMAEWFKTRMVHGFLLSPSISKLESTLSGARAASIFSLRAMGGLLQFTGMIKAYGSTVLKPKYIESEINLYRKMFLSPIAMVRVRDSMLRRVGTNIAAWTKADWAKYADLEVAEIVAEIKADSPVLYDRFLNNMILMQDSVRKTRNFIPDAQTSGLSTSASLWERSKEVLGNVPDNIRYDWVEKNLTHLMGGLYWGDALAVVAITKAAKRQAAAEGRDMKYAMDLALAATEETQVMDDDAYKSNLTLQSRGNTASGFLLRQLIAFQQESQSLINMYAQAHLRYKKGTKSYNGSSAGATYAKTLAIAGVGSSIAFAAVQVMRGALLKTMCGDSARIYKDATVSGVEGLASGNPVSPLLSPLLSQTALRLSNTKAARNLGLPPVGELRQEDLGDNIAGVFSPLVKSYNNVMEVNANKLFGSWRGAGSELGTFGKKSVPQAITAFGIPGDLARFLYKCITEKFSPSKRELIP